jgi:hypothetical protein
VVEALYKSLTADDVDFIFAPRQHLGIGMLYCASSHFSYARICLTYDTFFLENSAAAVLIFAEAVMADSVEHHTRPNSVCSALRNATPY